MGLWRLLQILYIQSSFGQGPGIESVADPSCSLKTCLGSEDGQATYQDFSLTCCLSLLQSNANRWLRGFKVISITRRNISCNILEFLVTEILVAHGVWKLTFLFLVLFLKNSLVLKHVGRKVTTFFICFVAAVWLFPSSHLRCCVFGLVFCWKVLTSVWVFLSSHLPCCVYGLVFAGRF